MYSTHSADSVSTFNTCFCNWYITNKTTFTIINCSYSFDLCNYVQYNTNYCDVYWPCNNSWQLNALDFRNYRYAKFYTDIILLIFAEYWLRAVYRIKFSSIEDNQVSFENTYWWCWISVAMIRMSFGWSWC